MGRIPDDIIQQVRDRVDIVGLVGRYLTLKKAGRSHKGLCPFHDEKTPSFNVNPDRQAFYCFGCQEGGNAISFVMKLENLSFPEALRVLAREVGIEVPETDGAPGQAARSEALFAANELAQAEYRRALATAGNPALPYLAGRGIDPETIERFGIGFAPDRWDFIEGALRRQRIAPEVGALAGLLAERRGGGHYDRLRGRVTFPIQDVRGRVIGFGGRALGADQEPKYLNSPETPIFRKGNAFFGFPLALEPIRRADRAIVVEGYFDLVAVDRAGMGCVLATCGTALTKEHARNLRRRTRNVVLLFDGDEAGHRATARALEVLLPEGLRVRAAVLAPGDDPDTLLAREGAPALRALVDAAPPVFDLLIQRAVAKGCGTPWEKADAVESLAPLIALVEEPVERGEIARQLAFAAGTEARHVEEALRAARGGRDAREAMPVPPRRASSDDRILRRLAQCAVEHPSVAAGFDPDRIVQLVPEDPAKELILAVLAVQDVEHIDLETLAEDLGETAARMLRSFAVEDFDLDANAARKTVEDTLARFERRRQKEEKTALTRRFLDKDADLELLLRQKQEQISERQKPGGPPL